jgi:hypothetical protein
VIVFAGLNLDQFLDQLPAPAIEKRLDCRALCLKAETAFALTFGANPQVANEFAVMLDHLPPHL